MNSCLESASDFSPLHRVATEGGKSELRDFHSLPDSCDLGRVAIHWWSRADGFPHVPQLTIEVCYDRSDPMIFSNEHSRN